MRALGSESVWLGCESGIEKKTRTGQVKEKQKVEGWRGLPRGATTNRGGFVTWF